MNWSGSLALPAGRSTAWAARWTASSTPREVQAGYNKGALKIEVLGNPSESGRRIRSTTRQQRNHDLWFGNFRAGIINGFKFEDRNQNGVYDPAIDVPLKGVDDVAQR